MMKAKAMIKAKAKAIPPLPFRRLVAVTKRSRDFVQDLCNICARFAQNFAKCIALLLTGDWAPSPPARENKHGP